LFFRMMLSIMVTVKTIDPGRIVAGAVSGTFWWLHRAAWRAHVGWHGETAAD
jgi:hypothetical protein